MGTRHSLLIELEKSKSLGQSVTGGGSQGTSISQTSLLGGGGTPEDLAEESEWQKGPQFLRHPVKEWPKKSAAEVAADAKEKVDKLQRKTFSAVLTRAQTKKDLGATQKESPNESSLEGRRDSVNVVSDSGICENAKEPNLPRETPGNLVIKKLVDGKKFSNLTN